ncbi:MAG: sulfotransferase [Myxococcota bacterium]
MPEPSVSAAPIEDPLGSESLVFLIGSPRSGSTLLSRMLGAHSKIFAPEEPHLITPLAHLGYFESVDEAPYDPVITRAAARAMVGALPGGEADYLRALRAYSNSVYRGLLDGHVGQATDPAAPAPQLILDKTPAYALSLEFLQRLYPNARYIVLTRNPLAVWSSFVDSFFDGDDAVAHGHNPLLERYVPAIGRFVRQAESPESALRVHRVQYEDLVQDPEASARNLMDFLDLEFEANVVNYGAAPDAKGESTRGLGDPMTVAKESRPTTSSLSKWAKAASGRPDRVRLYEQMLGRLLDPDLESWGFTRAGIQAELDQVDLQGKPKPAAPLTRYSLERKALVEVRRRVQPDNALGKGIRKLREICDVLLR